MTSQEVRQMFLDFWESKEHKVMPSANLIPVEDPTLLWINSGVAALKKYFDGTKIPESKRMVNSQKSIRTNDIENVGLTARHHTLFEMLGNFSVGDYTKEEVIPWAWELLTSPEWFGFDPDLLYITYYPEDEETKKLWSQIDNFDESHLVPEEGNFWDLGAGPCGPNTEIFYDRGEEYNDVAEDDPENYPGGENERWLEIWNLVFSEFNHMPDDTYEPLPNKNVDAGMGLERMVSVIQDTPTNFETDLFMPIIKAIESLTDGYVYEESGEKTASFKVIADHIRAVTFAISDGALPSNEGRGYILRRLIRRSVMHGRRLGINGLFLSKLVPVVVEVMGDFYSELNSNMDFVQKIIKNEEERFHETLEGGESHLESVIAELKEEGNTVIPGDQAFKLYDTFGFPLELTQEEAEQRGMSVDEEGFKVEMESQRERARSARSDEGSMKAQSDVLLKLDVPSEFVGYDMLETNGTVKAIIIEDQLVDQVPAESEGIVIFNRTPFFSEKGGQIADAGGIYDGDDLIAEIIDVQLAPNGQNMHRIKTKEYPLNKEQSYTLRVDRTLRLKTMKNHTATHLLHYACQQVLGSHALQHGSYVGPDRLRFDFTHFEKVTDEELQQIEDLVNDWIYNAVAVSIDYMPIESAKEVGAIMLFGETYGEIVRVVNIGNESIELCGGTHCHNALDIGTFKIISESGIGAGIRRIEALTGSGAVEYYKEHDDLLHQIQAELKVQQLDQLSNRIQQMQETIKTQESKIESLTAKLMQEESQNLFEDIKQAGDVTYLSVRQDNQSVDALRKLGDMWRQKEVSDILVITSKQAEDKVTLMVLVSDQLVKEGYKAGDIIKPLAKVLGGGGGGRPQMAQAGGKKPEKIDEMIKQIEQVITDSKA